MELVFKTGAGRSRKADAKRRGANPQSRRNEMINFNLVTERVDKGETVMFLVPQKDQNDSFQLGYRES